ncbi:hypothetical protein CI109_104638 [Kwoniella shandongensis]|uniref:Uncharacterized protein n=1 Tax=Kwoniella shandongensis TaxID=1734106 RepID=A0A5M6BVC3_9TREE|nr:uncharacterized protein CI109_004804 [Kwoniella shandongensis]KAA5526804.1 hypothetical protein CI109_004804 [Kwoniella shandongensis]
MYHTLALFALCMTLTNAAAGPHAHGGSRFQSSHRRHHARGAVAGRQAGDETAVAVATRDEESCTLGAWKCVGTELQRCYNEQWNFVQNCTGKDIICSDDLYSTGCVWTWSVQNPTNESTTSTSSAELCGPTTPSSTAITPATSTPAVLITTPTTENDDGDDADDSDDADDADHNDDEDDADDCDDEDDNDDKDEAGDCDNEDDNDNGGDGEGDAAGQAVNEGDDEDDADLPWCEDESESSTSAAYPISITTTAASTLTASASASPSTSYIGGGLWAGGDGNDDEASSLDSVTATATSTGWSWGGWDHGHGGHEGHGHKSSSSESASDSASTSIRPTDSEGDFLSVTSTSTVERSAALPVSTSTSPEVWSVSATVSSTASPTQTNSTSTSGYYSSAANASASATFSSHRASSTESASASAVSATPTGKTNETIIPISGGFSAPHYVIYADEWLYEMPAVSDLTAYNRFILAFWMTDTGAVDDAQAWAQWDADYRAQVLEDYHEAGIALMVSAFGSTDQPTSNGADPVETAQNLAQYVKDYGLDGVDIDYEDMSAMNHAKAVAWIVEFQRELRRLLPSPYIISHAPVAPWFTSAADYSDGAYTAIHQQVGDTIDFYNVQFYNQGHDQYVTCETLINNSGYNWPGTSVFELNSSAGIPLNKIVIGKPLDTGAADNGYMSPSLLKQCANQAQAKGWNGGVMFWEWTEEAPAVMAAVRA